MKTLLNDDDLNEALKNVSNLGFVPTMGSLHKGHISLIKQSINKSRKTLVSIYINPKQFNNKKDFKKYPKNIKKDLSILKSLKVDFVYLPKTKDIYNKKRLKKIKLKRKDKILCAKYRKGHFEGVLDIMDRLVKKIKPKYVFMGLKDFQQFYLVKNYIEKKYECKVLACKTIRNKNKLALSSRNFLLNKKDFNKAERLSIDLFRLKIKLGKLINVSKFLNDTKIILSKKYNLNIEYLELRNKKNLKETNNIKFSNLFVAYYLKKIRLIDNF